MKIKMMLVIHRILKNELCERCFKLKNYNVLTNTGVKIDNEELIKKNK